METIFKLSIALILINCNKVMSVELVSGPTFLAEELVPELVNVSVPALRYGFQDTHACQNFDKAFLCIRKCLDLLYDVAHSDKKCKCRCFKKADKAKYRPANVTAYNGTATAPTTKLPYWIQDLLPSTPKSNSSSSEENDSAETKRDNIKNSTSTSTPTKSSGSIPTESGNSALPNETVVTTDTTGTIPSESNTTAESGEQTSQKTTGDQTTDQTSTNTTETSPKA